jgi:hypothetical protein
MPTQTAIRDEVTARIVDALEADLLPWRQPWRSAAASPVVIATWRAGSRMPESTLSCSNSMSFDSVYGGERKSANYTRRIAAPTKKRGRLING